MTTIKIYHNPRCSKSRKTLELLLENGKRPEVIKYLETPPSVAELTDILKMLGMQPRDLIRKNEAEYKQNNMDNEKLSEKELIQLMVAFPKVIQRPIVVVAGKAAIGRPPENVLSII